MSFGVWHGESPRDTNGYGEGFHRGQASRRVGLSIQTCRTKHWPIGSNHARQTPVLVPSCPQIDLPESITLNRAAKQRTALEQFAQPSPRSRQ
jgi:hypothetical protein